MPTCSELLKGARSGDAVAAQLCWLTCHRCPAAWPPQHDVGSLNGTSINGIAIGRDYKVRRAAARAAARAAPRSFSSHLMHACMPWQGRLQLAWLALSVLSARLTWAALVAAGPGR